jgi:hypothetical protein
MPTKRIQVSPRIKAELQRETGSRCALCPDTDVGHFEIHHIDEDPSNDVYENLLLLCRKCHSKLTKNEWPREKAIKIKRELLIKTDYRLFESSPIETYDYFGYGMKPENGRLPKDVSNGAKANVKVIDIFRYKISVLQIDGRRWTGELNLTDRLSGQLSLKYDNEYEYAQKICFLSSTANGKEQVIFLKPPTESKDYENEMFIRKTV